MTREVKVSEKFTAVLYLHRFGMTTWLLPSAAHRLMISMSLPVWEKLTTKNLKKTSNLIKRTIKKTKKKSPPQRMTLQNNPFRTNRKSENHLSAKNAPADGTGKLTPTFRCRFVNGSVFYFFTQPVVYPSLYEQGQIVGQLQQLRER